MVSGTNSKKKIEILRSIQFAIIFFFYACKIFFLKIMKFLIFTGSWIYYEFVTINMIDWVPANAMSTVFILLECMANAILNATLNENVKNVFKIAQLFKILDPKISTSVLLLLQISYSSKIWKNCIYN